jgi:hypothetical protein
VKNVRSAGGGEIHAKAGVKPFRVTEIPVEERAPIIAAYREKAGRQVNTYWEKLPDPADHPIFRIDAN